MENLISPILAAALLTVISFHLLFGGTVIGFLAFEAAENEAIDRAVAGILADVKARGDVAVLEYTSRFDRFEASSVSAPEIHQDGWVR